MSLNRKISLSHILLSACSLGLASYLVLSLPEHEVFGTAAEGGKATSAESLSYAIFATAPIKDYAETVERPLFSRSRRPPLEIQRVQKAPPITRAPTIKRIKPVLVGVVIRGGIRTALIRFTPTGELKRVNQQEYVDGWMAAEITKSSVVLIDQSGGNQILDLKDNKTTPRSTNKRIKRAPSSQVQSQLNQQRKRLEEMKQKARDQSVTSKPRQAQIVNKLNKRAK